MNHVHRAIIGIVLALFLFGCNKQTGETVALSDLPPVNIPADSDYVIEIKNWLAIGPFDFNPLLTDPATLFSHKDLKKYGIEEGAIDEKGVEKLQRKGANVFLLDVPSPQIRLFRYVTGNIKTKSNFYLVAKIHSDKAQEATLVMDGSNSYAAWLNGNKLIEVKGKYNTNKVGDRFVNVSLQKGDNALFFKVNRGTNLHSWDLICAIASPREGQRIFCVNYASDFVVNPIIDHHPLEIYAGPYTNGKVEVLNNEGQIVSDLQTVEDGFYKVKLSVGEETLQETIYKGDYNLFAKKVKAVVSENNSSNQQAEDMKAALQRVVFLNDKPGDPNSPSETRYLNRNRVFWGYSLYKQLEGNALTQLMTYRDDEGQSGVFIFHNGRKREEKIPLVIIVPSALEGNLMIEDWYTGNLDQIEADNKLAGQHGFAVAWIYAGGRNYSAINTQKEITAVIGRLQIEYNIDDQQIFITGDCEGGRRVLLQLAATPNRYAACVASSPITLSGGADGVPVQLISQMGKTPILIRHGYDDDTTPVEHSRKFYAEAQKLDMQVTYIEIEGSHISISKDLHRYVFDFFSQWR
ncbi:hypothetical protein FACS189426_23580 [Bacteroidia bacterium]|nr:hypothetical protein FACS189426_23580 [Bacteroidia bacterium]